MLGLNNHLPPFLVYVVSNDQARLCVYVHACLNLLISTKTSRAGSYLPGYDSYQGLVSVGGISLVCSLLVLRFLFFSDLVLADYIFDLALFSGHAKRRPKTGFKYRL